MGHNSEPWLVFLFWKIRNLLKSLFRTDNNIVYYALILLAIGPDIVGYWTNDDCPRWCGYGAAGLCLSFVTRYCIVLLISCQGTGQNFNQNTIMELVPSFENSFILWQASMLIHHHYAQLNRKISVTTINMQTKQRNRIIHGE